MTRAVVASPRDIAGSRRRARSCSTTIAPRYAERPGGYTRLLRLGHRRGDAAEVAAVELLGSEYNPQGRAKKPPRRPSGEKPKKKTMGGRIREALPAAARRPTADAGGKVEKPAKGAGKKITTPRKAGGS